ncbi:hypothetical protein [Paenibacillus sp. IHBB 10380]|uniref:hypothetical protein n=1 Tax=Paenibacillus sp. IHBB 10380 TaxID=1566358 RepID=UPI0005CFB6D3|nr:hypothetical protein [Paenibacillus sp. IHBB 10380]AJS57626.1 hypothetical protein UB51_03015 [Paenibacillus sp. IHBB 10380]
MNSIIASTVVITYLSQTLKPPNFPPETAISLDLALPEKKTPLSFLDEKQCDSRQLSYSSASD